MEPRTHWRQKIDTLWTKKPIVWLSGVRRVGKTSLCRQIPEARYFNCDLPSVQRQLTDPELFLAGQGDGAPLVLDEVHRIADPALLLKIAADEHPRLRLLATGSSTLEATTRFRDTLTDRKRSLGLPPVLWRECQDAFRRPGLDRRLLCGGLPGMLLAGSPEPDFFEDWIDSFYARDIQELFGVRNRTGFLALFRLVVLRNGGLLEVSDLAKESRLSRPTVMSHLDALEVAHAIVRIPPYHGGGHREIIRQPRAYAFDTGLVAHVRGYESIRESDRGHLWENLVLDELRAAFPWSSIHHWRDKSQREVDFVIERPAGRVDAIEAKINPDALDPGGLEAFRRLHPRGANVVLCPHVREPYSARAGRLTVTIMSTSHLPHA